MEKPVNLQRRLSGLNRAYWPKKLITDWEKQRKRKVNGGKEEERQGYMYYLTYP